MATILATYYRLQSAWLDRWSNASGLAPLLLRVYLIPVFWMAGTSKIDLDTLMPYEHTVAWFGDDLALPLPTLMAFLAGWTEILGAGLLALGLAVRWISIPLMITMLVAIFTVHIDYGWQAIADPSAPFANNRVLESVERLDRAKSILSQYGNYSWLTGRGHLVVLNNGIEFAATYLLMLLALFFSGGGRYVSVDYWLNRYFSPMRASFKH